MGSIINKVPPYYFKGDLETRFDKISKAAWADIYFDLYCQAMGENKTPAEAMEDAEKRLAILKENEIR